MKKRRRAAALQNETATTIHPRVSRFGGCTCYLDLSFSAAESPATECKCERKCSAGCVTFGCSHRAGLSNRDSSAGPGVFVSGSDARQHAATQAAYSHTLV